MFYKNRHGEAQRFVAEDAVLTIKKEGWTQERQDELLAADALSESDSDTE